jgi:hypothetical protein
MEKLSTEELRTIFTNYCIFKKIPVCLPLHGSEWDLLIMHQNKWQTVKCIWTSYKGTTKGFIASIQRRKGIILADLYFVFTSDKTTFLIPKNTFSGTRIITSTHPHHRLHHVY